VTKTDLEEDCQEALKKLINKKIVDVKFKSYNSNCWRLHMDTDKGKMVITFCNEWICPVVEYRKP
jgi:hypothetical protein